MSLPCGRKKNAIAQAPLLSKAEWQGKLNAYLKSKNLRSTGPREKVAEIALQQRSHFEIQELIKLVQVKYPEISPATVYRSVSTLCEAGILTETLTGQSGVKLYEPHEDEHHDHIVCIDCGEIFEFHDESMERAQKKAMSEQKFIEMRHRHVVYAKCGLLKKA